MLRIVLHVSEYFFFTFHLFQADILPHIRRLSAEQASVVEEQHYVQYTSLLGAYAGSIRDEKVTRDRNPLMFTIAAEELGSFIKRHTRQV
ncbi:hypothetical protein ANCDUO_09734 [Ancylostoma duodenale]|uniref:Uncharacterized protein n=1 Tax=Ancylostoma duodenale TaxID=51022 RepID=A0A0C2GSH7_9BILA|nr:hypothetical protein ANCDUO_09734 [Ancylostoma duodenale]